MLYSLAWETRRDAPAIISHFSLCDWDKSRWPNFTADEFACKHCGELFFWPDFFDRAQYLRSCLGRPVRFNSAHRCAIHNARVGGAPLSQHKRQAIDVRLSGHPDRFEVLSAARAAGFTGFGYYQTFLHLDLGRPRFWYGKGAKPLWLLD